ncbi:NADPH oxidase 1 isoform X2 [Haemorhous mexicanus]|uniref:NADPH oxidase 1 isoform X2 n=1 Tax=Haemorhous mexicanus TaxID=30427 RepID=UPI0028BDB011|nr:NADPH oxidase 1 isoform X2 [Haemorhous mexicanus]
MGSSISQVPQLQQHADPAARLPQPALLPPWDLLGECPVVAQPAWPSPSCPILTPSCCLSLQCCRQTLRKQLDHNLTFHKLLGYTLALLTAVHTIAHLFNLERYNQSQQGTDGSLPAVLSKMHLQGSKWLNPIHSNQTTVEYVAFTTIPGLTGVIITLALILMVTSSTEFIRRNYFELFWYTHHLFLIYFAGLVIHGIAGLVRGQTEQSMAEVHPYHCAEYLTQREQNCTHRCCKDPEFGSIPAESWKWVLAPIILYVFERILRVWRAQQKVVVKKVVMHPARVLELQMQKKGFCMEVGQYIFVNCPAISTLEWHPFTLTSAPEEDFFSIHIRAAGDWTERLIDIFQLETPRVQVDGPFGTASEDVFQYKVAMLVGAGIGVTPFASILKSIWYKFQQADQTLKTKKIYFYWLCRDTGAFAWFNDLLASLEQKMAESGKADFLTYRLFLTGWDTSIGSGGCVPLWARGPGEEPAEVLSPTLQPGPQEGQILLQQGKLLSGSKPVAPEGRDPDCTASSLSKAGQGEACTEAKQDTARYSVSMRNSRFKDCCVPVLVYKGSSWSKWACSSTQPPHWETRATFCDAVGAAGSSGSSAGWAEPLDGDGTWASMQVSGAKCGPQGLKTLLYKNKLNFLFFVMKASVVTELCRYKGAHALPLAGLQ